MVTYKMDEIHTHTLKKQKITLKISNVLLKEM